MSRRQRFSRFLCILLLAQFLVIGVANNAYAPSVDIAQPDWLRRDPDGPGLPGLGGGGPTPIFTGLLPIYRDDPTRGLFDLINGLKTDTALRVALISSGVELSAFPSAIQSKISVLGNTGDAVGYGTYAASVLFQLAPTSTVTSIGVYPGGALNPDYVRDALGWVRYSGTPLDVVLFAFPPSDFLDPLTAAMASPGGLEHLMELLYRGPYETPTGPLYGISTTNEFWNQSFRSPGSLGGLQAHKFALERWSLILRLIQEITDAGVAIVVPAGDLGPSPRASSGSPTCPRS